MRQVFWNLASNALRAMPEGGRLEVSGRVAENFYQLRFQDDGCGMTEEERTHLFQPFRTFFDDGLGLGLAVVYRIVEEHGGEIEVDSQLGAGSTITVELPIEPPDGETSKEEATS
jgi:signal transduction histidine kinase